MSNPWNYFFGPPQPPHNHVPNIEFGEWSSQLDYLDEKHSKVATRLIKFIKEAGPDPYNRIFNMEAILNFALERNITNKTADYIYRHYVYYLISQVEDIDIAAAEARFKQIRDR